MSVYEVSVLSTAENIACTTSYFATKTLGTCSCLYLKIENHQSFITEIRHSVMTSSNGNIFRATGPLCGVHGEFPAQRPVTQSFDVCIDMHTNKRLSKQSWGWWFETPSRPLWRHCNVTILLSSATSISVVKWFCNAAQSAVTSYKMHKP